MLAAIWIGKVPYTAMLLLLAIESLLVLGAAALLFRRNPPPGVPGILFIIWVFVGTAVVLDIVLYGLIFLGAGREAAVRFPAIDLATVGWCAAALATPLLFTMTAPLGPGGQASDRTRAAIREIGVTTATPAVLVMLVPFFALPLVLVLALFIEPPRISVRGVLGTVLVVARLFASFHFAMIPDREIDTFPRLFLPGRAK